jgi:hypothetical protein
MNSAVQNVLLETSKNYPASSFFGKFTTRFLMQEVCECSRWTLMHADDVHKLNI